MNKKFLSVSLITTAVFLTGCVSTPVQMGNAGAKTVATGSAGGSSTSNVNSSLERCAKPVGTLGIKEDTYASWYSYMNRYGVRSVIYESLWRKISNTNLAITSTAKQLLCCCRT